MALIAENQTVSRCVYGMSIRNTLSVAEDFILSMQGRIDRAYDMGEPIANDRLRRVAVALRASSAQ